MLTILQEREHDRNKNNEAFHDVIRDLFDILHSWELTNGLSSNSSSSGSPSFSLILTAESPGDYDRIEESLDDIGRRRWAKSFLKIDGFQDIKSVRSIAKFRTPYSFGGRALDPASMAILSSKMIGLQQVDWSFVDEQRRTLSMDDRRDRRYKFSQCLTQLPLQSLTHLKLALRYIVPANHSWKIPSVLHPADQEIDSLSRAIHAVSQAPNLRLLILENGMVLSTSIFGPVQTKAPVTASHPEAGTDKAKQPLWPSLEHFIIQLSPVTPEGSWLLEGNANSMNPQYEYSSEDFDDVDDELMIDFDIENTDEPDRINERAEAIEAGDEPIWFYRSQMNTALFEPWVTQMALATNHMPKLKWGALSMTTKWRDTDDGEKQEFMVDVECKTVAAGRKNWEVRVGKSLEYVPDEKLVRFLDNDAGDEGSVIVQFDSSGREKLMRWSYQSLPPF
ncbi:hypothetical protein BT63DRAFT_228707 [Microthyrium microscopicum]|uniref:Uncharacterized protein n=1 Tax=Microthyrium microscopicum TaxID=703497 RepID=A0A6A6UF43_9PEZI|nr:hypothetical protein BT63DRAFT_228707 [Microthyrium microscopicum]